MVTSLKRSGRCVRSFLSLLAGPASGSGLDEHFGRNAPGACCFLVSASYKEVDGVSSNICDISFDQ